MEPLKKWEPKFTKVCDFKYVYLQKEFAGDLCWRPASRMWWGFNILLPVVRRKTLPPTDHVAQRHIFLIIVRRFKWWFICQLSLNITMHFFLSVREGPFLSVFPDIRSDSHNEFGSAVWKIDCPTWPEVMEQAESSDWSVSLFSPWLVRFSVIVFLVSRRGEDGSIVGVALSVKANKRGQKQSGSGLTSLNILKRVRF